MIVAIRVTKQFSKPVILSKSCKNSVFNLRIVSVYHYISRSWYNNLSDYLRVLLCIRLVAIMNTDFTSNKVVVPIYFKVIHMSFTNSFYRSKYMIIFSIKRLNFSKC